MVDNMGTNGGGGGAIKYGWWLVVVVVVCCGGRKTESGCSGVKAGGCGAWYTFGRESMPTIWNHSFARRYWSGYSLGSCGTVSARFRAQHHIILKANSFTF